MTLEPRRLNRREALSRVVAATAVLKTFDYSALGAPIATEPGIGSDPNLLEKTIPWARVLSPLELRTVAALADTFLPAEPPHPSASAVGVPDFIDEWVSAPYQDQQSDQKKVRNALDWFDRTSRTKHQKPFADLAESERIALFEAILAGKTPEPDQALSFYQKIRQLVMGGYYSTPQGWTDIGYVGNRPIGGDWPGPPKEILEKLGLAN